MYGPGARPLTPASLRSRNVAVQARANCALHVDRALRRPWPAAAPGAGPGAGARDADNAAPSQSISSWRQHETGEKWASRGSAAGTGHLVEEFEASGPGLSRNEMDVRLHRDRHPPPRPLDLGTRRFNPSAEAAEPPALGSCPGLTHAGEDEDGRIRRGRGKPQIRPESPMLSAMRRRVGPMLTVRQDRRHRTGCREQGTVMPSARTTVRRPSPDRRSGRGVERRPDRSNLRVESPPRPIAAGDGPPPSRGCSDPQWTRR